MNTAQAERIGGGELAGMTAALSNKLTARAIREYVRSTLMESVVKRVFDIGMGVETFDVPTMAGNTLNIPASAAVQVKALSALLQVGVPTQLGLVDDDGATLPGVIALGELDMRSVQDEAATARLGAAARLFGADETAVALDRALTPEMERRVAAGEFEIVETNETVGELRVVADAAPPPIDTSELTPEQAILAKRKARRVATNGR